MHTILVQAIRVQAVINILNNKLSIFSKKLISSSNKLSMIVHAFLVHASRESQGNPVSLWIAFGTHPINWRRPRDSRKIEMGSRGPPTLLAQACESSSLLRAQ